MPFYADREEVTRRLGWIKYAADGRIVVHQWGTDDDSVVFERYLPGTDVDARTAREVGATIRALDLAPEVGYLGSLSLEGAQELRDSLERELSAPSASH